MCPKICDTYYVYSIMLNVDSRYKRYTIFNYVKLLLMLDSTIYSTI